MALDRIPDELVRHILYYVAPEANLAAVQPLSRRLHRLANDALLWKHYCVASFRYWGPEHRLAAKLALRASEVAWKALWVERRRRDARAARLLDGILATRVGRVGRFEQICALGYDAKDFLLGQCRTPDDADDVLARRYYASTALGSIHRGVAVEEWFQYQQAGPPASHRLDRALAAFDMFFLYDEPDQHDIDDTCRLFDRLAASFLADTPRYEEKSTREKALALLRWTRGRNLTGMDDPQRNYRCLRNCLVGHALRDERHPSLPIISSAIYCCLAERVGLRAACCAFPSHVHAMVTAPPGATLDGDRPEPPGAEAGRMFLDPYGSDAEVTLKDLRARLVELGWTAGSDVFLAPSPVPVIVQRTAQNMKAAYQAASAPLLPEFTLHLLGLLLGGGGGRGRGGRPEANMDNAAYAAMWANLLMTPVSGFDWDSALDAFLARFRQQFSEDAWLVERRLLPLYEAFTALQGEGAGPAGAAPGGPGRPRHRSSWENVQVVLSMVRNVDQRLPTVSRRYTQDIHDNVWYRVGQVFRHRRYGYVGVINGWGDEGTGSLPTPHSLSMDETLEVFDGDAAGAAGDEPPRSRARKKTYYTCLRSAIDRHVVAQDNIQIITDPAQIPDSLHYVAGKYFKRFDPGTCTFVSNIKEFFPDD